MTVVRCRRSIRSEPGLTMNLAEETWGTGDVSTTPDSQTPAAEKARGVKVNTDMASVLVDGGQYRVCGAK